MHLVGTVRLPAPARVTESLGHEVVAAQTARAVDLHAAVDNRLHHDRYAGLAGRDHVARLLRADGDVLGVEQALRGDDGAPVSLRAGILLVQLMLENRRRAEALGTATALVEAYPRAVAELVEHCRNPDAGGYTPSDFPLMDFDQSELDDLANDLASDLAGDLAGAFEEDGS